MFVYSWERYRKMVSLCLMNRVITNFLIHRNAHLLVVPLRRFILSCLSMNDKTKNMTKSVQQKSVLEEILTYEPKKAKTTAEKGKLNIKKSDHSY